MRSARCSGPVAKSAVGPGRSPVFVFVLQSDLAGIPGSDAELPGEWRSLTRDLKSSLGSA